MEETGIEQARKGLGEIVDRARFRGEPTLITRTGKPAAVVVGSDWYAAVTSFIDENGPARLEIDAYGGNYPQEQERPES